MSIIAPLLVSLWLGAAPPSEAPRIANELLEEFEYARRLFEPFETSSGGEAEQKEAPHPSGKTWSREGWRQGEKSDLNRHHGLPDQRGWPRRRPEPPSGGGGGWSGLGPLLEILVWIAIAVLVGTVIAALVRGAEQRKRKTKLTVAPVEEAQAELGAPISEAERLAGEGRYEEAVHLLLLKTIEALVVSQPDGVPEAWTSREIQQDFKMRDEARAPFGTLVDVVEQSLFGGRPVDQEAWDTCQHRFHAFERAYRGASR